MKKSPRPPKSQAAAQAAPANPLQHVAMQMFEHGKRVGFKKGVDAAKQHVQSQPQSPQQLQVQKALDFLRNLPSRPQQAPSPLVRRPLR